MAEGLEVARSVRSAAGASHDVVDVRRGDGAALAQALDAERVAPQVGDADQAPAVPVAASRSGRARGVDLRAQRTVVLRTARTAADEGVAAGFGATVGWTLRHVMQRARSRRLDPIAWRGVDHA